MTRSCERKPSRKLNVALARLRTFMIRIAVELSYLLVIYEYFILLGVPERGSKRLDVFLVDGDGCFIAHYDEWLLAGSLRQRFNTI
jgi:deoxyinosine 3'endonuclease (endonuclease V)